MTLIFSSMSLAENQQSDDVIAKTPLSNVFPLISRNYQPPEEIDIKKYPNIVITMEKDNKSLSCHLDTISETYICPNGNSPILVKQQFADFTALGKDEELNIKTLPIIQIKSDKTILVTNQPNGGWPIDEGFKKPAPSLERSAYEKIMAVSSFFDLWENANTRELKGSEEFKKIAKEFINEKNSALTFAQKISEEEKFQVELENGQKINCTRESKKPIPKEMERAYKNYACGSFNCDPVFFNGDEFQASMIFDSTPGSTIGGSIHLTHKNKIAPPVFIKKVFTSLSTMPVVDYSSYLENSKLPTEKMSFDPQLMAAMGIAEPLPEALPENLERIKSNIDLYQNPNFDMTLESYQYVCSNKQGSLINTAAARDVVLNEVANTRMAQLISLLSDGSLLGQYIDPNQAGKYGCFYQGAYLNEAAAKNLDKIKKNINPDDNVEETISIDRANKLFEKAQQMKDIAWDYKPDGCYARAHLMARRFEDEGVRVDKVWIKGDLYVPGTQPEISWNFHVAPIVYVEDKKGKINKMVIDPSLFDRPVTVDEWDQKMSKRTKLGSLVTRFPFPENAASLQRSTLAFSSSDPYLPGDNISMTEKEKMEKAEATMLMYKSIGQLQDITTFENKSL